MNYIEKFPIFSEDIYKVEPLYPRIQLEDIENTIVKILDKHSDLCKYYINISDASFNVSFNVDESQLNAMIKTSFTINLYKYNNNPLVILSKEVQEFNQWNVILVDLLKKLK
jgi:hypothetical protein